MTQAKEKQNKEFYVSVIIPVFNDFERLDSCLSALENQSYPRDMYEVIVIDNGSTEDISQTSQKYANVNFYNETRQGSYAARNKGIENSVGNVIAFTDSDCIPSSDWIEMGVKTLMDNPDCGLVGGKIELFYQNPQKLTAVELWENVWAFDQQNYINNNYAATANVFTLRRVICDVGDFNKELVSSGDLEWGKRVHASGYKLLYSDKTIVNHPARRTLSEYYSKQARIVRGHYKLNLIDTSPRALFNESIQPILGIKHFLFHPRLGKIEGKTNKLKVVFVMIFRRYLEVWEVVKIKFRDRLKKIAADEDE